MLSKQTLHIQLQNLELCRKKEKERRNTEKRVFDNVKVSEERFLDPGR